MIKDTKYKINEPKVNQVVFFKPWQSKKEAKKKAYPVIINDGQYMGTYGLSNFWNYQRISPTGRINRNVEQCYGNFTLASGFIIRVIAETLVTDENTALLVSRHITVV